MTIDEQIAALERIKARGARRGRIGGEEVEFYSLAEIDRAIADLRDQREGRRKGTFASVYPETGRGL